jgi:hypothetical protein
VSTALQVSHPPAPATAPPAATHLPRSRVGQLRRFQWAVRATLTVGVAASVCANVLHARDNPISQAIAAWPPLALLLTVELVSRVPVHRRLLAAARIGGTAVIAGIAAYVSYFHMAAVVSRYGEHQPNPYLLPLSVDGMIVVASVSLVELSGRVRAALETVALEQAAHDQHAPVIRSAAPEDAPDPADPVPPPPAVATPRAELADRPAVTPADVDLARCAPTPAAPVQPANGGKPRAASPNGHEANHRDRDAPGVAMTTLPAPGIPANLAPPRDDIPRRNAAPAANADPDLIALLPAARAARDELLRQGRSLSRDSLARQLRRGGHTSRTARVSELLTLLKNDPTEPINGRQPPPADDHDDRP